MNLFLWKETGNFRPNRPTPSVPSMIGSLFLLPVPASPGSPLFVRFARGVFFFNRKCRCIFFKELLYNVDTQHTHIHPYKRTHVKNGVNFQFKNSKLCSQIIVYFLNFNSIFKTFISNLKKMIDKIL